MFSINIYNMLPWCNAPLFFRTIVTIRCNTFGDILQTDSLIIYVTRNELSNILNLFYSFHHEQHNIKLGMSIHRIFYYNHSTKEQAV